MFEYIMNGSSELKPAFFCLFVFLASQKNLTSGQRRAVSRMRSLVNDIKNLLLVSASLWCLTLKLLMILFLGFVVNYARCCLRQAADEELFRMETTPGEPKTDSRVSIMTWLFLQIRCIKWIFLCFIVALDTSILHHSSGVRTTEC